MSIVVAGASGQLGKLVSEILVELMTPSDVILATRTPDALAVFARKGAQVRHGDFDQPEALPAALAGAKRMLLISTDALGRRVEQHRNAIEAAKAAGVEHIVYTSVLNPTSSNPAFVVEEHAETEGLLLDSGLAWTMLRMGNYTEFLVAPGIEAVHEGTYPHNCGNGKVAY